MSEKEIIDAVGRLRTRDQVVEMAVSLDATITGLRAEIVALRSALRECADDLAGEIDARNAGDALKYPTMKARYDRDMAPVVRARALLEGKGR